MASDGSPPAGSSRFDDQPWFRLPVPQRHHAREVLVIGAGIAGCCAAYSLASRGFRVKLLEREGVLAARASGNPAAVILPRLAAANNAAHRIFLAAYETALTRIATLLAAGNELGWRASGVVHLPAEPRVAQLLGKLETLGLPSDIARVIDGDETRSLTGMANLGPALFYPRAGVLDPVAFCLAHTTNPLIEVITHRDIVNLHREDGIWRASNGQARVLATAETVVLANGHEGTAFPLTRWLPLVSVRGQLACIPRAMAPVFPKTVVCYGGYFIPDWHGKHILGATFNRGGAELRTKDQEQLLARAKARLPGFHLSEPVPTMGRVAYRGKSLDYLPIAGPVPDYQRFLTDYGDLHHGRKYKSYPFGAYLPGLFVSLGHAGRGMVSCPLAGELVAAQICGEELPLAQDLVDALNPARFLIRALKRGEPI